MLVWDVFVRSVHWTLAALIAIELFNEAGANPWHRYFGYGAGTLVLARLAWGLGPVGEARLARMLGTAREAPAYLGALRAGRTRTYLGHNPLGALMAFMLWALILAVAGTGWMTQLDAFWGEEWLQEFHSVLSYVLAAFAVLHVTGVLVTSRLYRMDLVASMVTGRKTPR